MTTNIAKLRRRMRRANYLYKQDIVLLRGAKLDRRAKQSVSLQMASYFEYDFRANLARHKLRFSYFKTDGSIRQAVGTLNPAFIPEEHRPKSTTERKTDSSTFPYYDLDRHAWRSFRLELFIGFVVQEV